MSSKWFVKVNSRVLGPIDSMKLKSLANEGKITPATEVATDATGPWSQAGKIKNLFTTMAAPQKLSGSLPTVPPIPVARIIDAPSTNVSELSVPVRKAEPTGFARFCADGQDPAVIAKLHDRVTQICTSSEEIRYMAVQQKPIANLSPDCVVLTNKRFIIFRQKILGRMNFLDCLWRDCADVHLEENLIGATVHFHGITGHKESVDYLPKAQARMIYRVAQEEEENAAILRRNLRLEEINAGTNKTVINQAIGPVTPQSTTSTNEDVVSRLAQLKQLFDNGIITEKDFEQKKSDLLKLL